MHTLLAQWKKLTLTENELIQSNDWNALEQLQSKKSLLQQSIEKLEEEFSQSALIPEERKVQERKRLKQLATELLLLEKKNEAILSERIAEADRELKNSNKTIQSLRHVQKAYGTGKSFFWQAYS
ncbi:MAG: hypothetical protein HYY23_18690 [Verrucomicrobia bacterium]|nr:hypothetical protein [Verrucomicrobiota bacterium]